MKIIIAEFYDDENKLHTVDVYEHTSDLDTEHVLNFIEFTKNYMGNKTIVRNKINMLFSDGIRVVLRFDELIHMADVKDYVNITKNVTHELDKDIQDE